MRTIRLRVVIRRYEAILAGSIMLLSGAVMPSYWEPPLRTLPVTIPSQPAPPLPRHPWIAFTFDDGPHPGMTDRLLAILKEQHVPSTFFVVGKMADRYPYLVRAIAQDGHEVGNHSYHHLNMARLSNEDVMNELNQTRDVIHRLTGQEGCLFRPPGGDYNRRMVRLASHAGYRMVLWSVLTDDVEGASRRAMQARILEGADDGGIILMHSGVETTIDILPKVIADLRARGYHFVTVSTLLGLAHSTIPVIPDTAPLQTAQAPSPSPVRTQ